MEGEDRIERTKAHVADSERRVERTAQRVAETADRVEETREISQERKTIIDQLFASLRRQRAERRGASR